MDPRVEKHFMQRTMKNIERDAFLFNFQQEMELSNIVKNGEVDRIPQLLQKNRGNYEHDAAQICYSQDPVKNDLYKFINAVVLFSRAAILGGVPEVIAYGIAESYIYCAEQYEADLFLDALTCFTEKVAEFQAKGRTDDTITQQIKYYVLDHLRSPIRIRDIAEALFVSESYCSHAFKEEEGITIHQYIDKVRVEASCSMLQYTNLPIQKIGEHFDFNRPGAYSAAFKKWKGMTPAEYRAGDHE